MSHGTVALVGRWRLCWQRSFLLLAHRPTIPDRSRHTGLGFYHRVNSSAPVHNAQSKPESERASEREPPINKGEREEWRRSLAFPRFCERAFCVSYSSREMIYEGGRRDEALLLVRFWSCGARAASYTSVCYSAR